MPLPVSVVADPTASFTLRSSSRIAVPKGSDDAAQVANDLAQLLRPVTGFALPVVTGAGRAGDVSLSLDANDTTLGAEGYTLTTTAKGVSIEANQAAGLFHGVQTLRQLLGSARSTVVPGGRITDYPRFAYRGAMLDVARHFFPVPTVERYIDELAIYKVNTLHLHLSDDQGWRIAIDGWPNLTTVGAATEVGGAAGGFYTAADYSEIVKYAAAHFMTVVPEIDMPGHTGAALSSYPSLNCDGTAPPVNTSTTVGASSLCVGKPATAQFVSDVVGQLAKLTSGPYVHIGGDEAASTSPSDYVSFVNSAADAVKKAGKTPMGWADIAKADLPAGSVTQYWDFRDPALARTAVQKGAKLVMSPADKAYLDQKYTASTPLGLQWAGIHEVPDAYNWDPATLVSGTSAAVIGVEGPLWTETLSSLADLEYMAWPRMAELADVGWTPQSQRSWSSFAPRLAAQGPIWSALGINFYASPLVPWPGKPAGSASSPPASSAAPADLSALVPTDLPGFTPSTSIAFDLSTYLSQVTTSPTRDEPVMKKDGFVGGYLAYMPPSPSGGIVIIFQVRDHAAALDLQKFQNDPNDPGVANRTTFAVPGIPGAIGSDYTLVAASEHDANVSVVVGSDVINVAWKGPRDTDHATLLSWATAVSKQAGAGRG